MLIEEPRENATEPLFVVILIRECGKPINVLTGLDYWLDNLMCNVPEVAMCYHLDGIVQVGNENMATLNL